MLCRLYVDEVGNSDLKNAPKDPNTRYLSLTGITTFRHLHADTIQPALDQLKADLFGQGPDTPVILHRREIIDRSGPFKVLNDDETRSEFDQRTLSLIGDLPYIANTVTIDKAEHFDRYGVWHFDPYHYCLRCLVERYVLWLQRHGWRGDVVVEERVRKVDKKLKASFQRTWQQGTDQIPAPIVQARLTSRELKLYPKAKNCACLQLCDLIAHPSFRAMRRARDNEPQPVDFGGRVARILEAEKLARDPENGEDRWLGQKMAPLKKRGPIAPDEPFKGSPSSKAGLQTI
jgi:hypothetical protein